MTRRLILPIAAAAALAVVVTAAEAQQAAQPDQAAARPASFTFTGHGWGHGVGFSQYGARGRALAGWSAQRILAAYYPGTKLAVVKRRSVRILLGTSLSSVAVSSPRAWRLVGRRTDGRAVTPLKPGVTYIVRRLPGGALAVGSGGRRVATIPGEARVQTKVAASWIAWGASQPEAARRYHGALRFVPSSAGRFDLVNVADLEEYLKGVVPREMPADWADDSFAAVVAQAVAARSYAISTFSPTAKYDVLDDDRSQVYGGVSAEDPRTTRAVVKTRGTVLKYDGAVITAFFFSTSGGRTEAIQNVFPGTPPRPYLVSVPDPWDKISPYHVWPDPPTFTAARLGRLLGLGGPVRSVQILKRGDSPRVMDARFTTVSGRTADFTGTELRAALGLRDTWFSVRANPGPR